MQNKEAAEIKKKIGVYNMIPNLFWSALLLIPTTIFCYTRMEVKFVWIFLITSSLAVFLPRSFFDKIQLGNTSAIYKNIGVRFINRFTQNGEIVNGWMRKKYPGYKVITPTKISINKLVSQTYMFEKFHFILFLFFIMATVYAVVKGYFVWAFVFLIANIVYNIYPAFLQQYIRVKLKVFAKRIDRISHE